MAHFVLLKDRRTQSVITSSNPFWRWGATPPRIGHVGRDFLALRSLLGKCGRRRVLFLSPLRWAVKVSSSPFSPTTSLERIALRFWIFTKEEREEEREEDRTKLDGVQLLDDIKSVLPFGRNPETLIPSGSNSWTNKRWFHWFFSFNIINFNFIKVQSTVLDPVE